MVEPAVWKWVQARPPRPPRIPKRKWDEIKEEVCDLYRTKTLDEVMQTMKEKYGFEAKQRQCVHMLQKSGIKKDGVQANATSPDSDPSVVNTPAGLPGTLPATHGKRTRSVLSAQSSASNESRIANKARKKDPRTPDSKGDSKGATETPVSNIQLSPSAPLTSPPVAARIDFCQLPTCPPPQGALPPTPTRQQGTENVLPTPSSQPLTTTEPPTFPHNDKNSISSSPIPRIVPDAASSRPSLAERECSLPWQLPVMKQIDCNQLVDTLSAEDISNLEGAADFFSVFCYDQEAFELYTLALKRHQYDGKGRNAEYWSLVLQCVHSATRIEHVEIVQNILREDIRQLKEGKLGVYGKTEPFEFLLHMLMAFACYRNAAMDVVRVNLLKAAAVVDGVEGLSASYRSLHLVLYRNVLRLKHTRLGPAALADPSRPGRVRFVTVSLADPHYRAVSTSRVPPQDFGWWRRDAFLDTYLAARGLPPEVRDLIAEYAFVPDGPLLNRAEVAAFRADTAWERVRVAAEVNRLLWSYFVGTGDSGIPEGCTWSDSCGYLSKSFGEMDRDGESDNRGSSGDGSAAQHVL